jgi:hypothetical protein
MVLSGKEVKEEADSRGCPVTSLAQKWGCVRLRSPPGATGTQVDQHSDSIVEMSVCCEVSCHPTMGDDKLRPCFE